MPAKDLYHDVVVAALVKDNWLVTDDPLTLPFGSRDLLVDLGAERIIAAERGAERIAVEIKSFGSPSEMNDLEKAIGQFVLYGDVPTTVESDRVLFPAIRSETFLTVFQEPIGQMVLNNGRLRLLVFDPATAEVLQWLP